MRQLLWVMILLAWPAVPAQAYIDVAPTLGAVLKDSTGICVLQVDKVSRERKVIIFKKLADLKGTHPGEEVRQQITDGIDPGEAKFVLDWAEPGQIAVLFQNGNTALVCIGRFWYQCAAREQPWWSMTQGRGELLYCYCGSARKLGDHVKAMLAGKEVVIPGLAVNTTGLMYTHIAERNTRKMQRQIGLSLWRMRARLDMPSRQIEVQNTKKAIWVVGDGAASPEEVAELAAALKGPDARARVEAAQELSMLGAAAKSAAPALTKALDDSDPLVRLHAAAALSRLMPRQAGVREILVEGLRAKEIRLRLAAMDALADLGTSAQAALPALIDLLKDGDLAIRSAAVEAVAEVGVQSQTALPALLAAVKDPDLQVLAAGALGNFGATARKATPGLVEMVQKGAPAAQWAAARSLIHIDRGAARVAVPLCVEALKGSDLRARENALHCLYLLGPDAREAVPTLMGMAEKTPGGGVGGWLSASDVLRRIDPAAAKKAIHR